MVHPHHYQYIFKVLEDAVKFGLISCSNCLYEIIWSAQFPNNVTGSDFINELGKLGPSFETYAIRFGIIGMYWIAYHRLFNRISGSHPIIIALNLVFLFFVTLISLFTVLNINYGSLHIVFILYDIILILTGSMLAIIWLSAVKTRSIKNDTSPSLIKLILLQ